MNIKWKYLFILSVILIILPQNGSAIKHIKEFLKSIKKQIKKKVPTRNNAFDDSVVYAIPTKDGKGYILHGYGKPHDPYAHDKDVDIYQIPKMWNGQVKIPNFLDGLQHGYNHHERVVKGADKRLGFRLAIPFLGDFQYLRELGPGRFTDNLGPGKFEYSGFKDALNKNEGYGDEEYGIHHPDEHEPSHDSSYSHSYADEQGYTQHSPFDDHLVTRSSESRNTFNPGDPDLRTQDTIEELINYPWHSK